MLVGGACASPDGGGWGPVDGREDRICAVLVRVPFWYEDDSSPEGSVGRHDSRGLQVQPAPAGGWRLRDDERMRGSAKHKEA